MPKSDTDPHLGHKLREAMDLRGVIQAAVAVEFGVKPPTVSVDWLRKGRIDKKHYPRLVSYFGLPYEWWFGEAKSDPIITSILMSLSKMEESEKIALAEYLTARGDSKKNPTSKVVDEPQAKPIQSKPRRLGDAGKHRENTHSPDKEIERRKQEIQVIHERRKRPWDYGKQGDE